MDTELFVLVSVLFMTGWFNFCMFCNSIMWKKIYLTIQHAKICDVIIGHVQNNVNSVVPDKSDRQCL